MAFRNHSVALTADAAGVRAGVAQGVQAMEMYGQRVGGVARSVSQSGALMQAGLVGAVVAIGVAFHATVGAAAELEVQMRNVNSISKLSESQLGAVTDSVIEMSKVVPQSATDLAKGLYDIASSGFQGAQGLKILAASSRAATAGMTTTAVAAQGILAVLNAYGRSAADAEDISDVLFQTVNLGVIRFEELASQLGDVVGIAAAAKVPIDDLGAAIAAMTLAGISPAESSTSLNRVIQSLLQPSEDLTVVLRQLGYESGAVALEQDGLQVVMEKIRVATGGSATAFLQLFGDIRAARGAFALAANEGRNYARTQAEIGNETLRVGATQDAFAEQMKATTNQIKLFGNELKATAVSAGRALLPSILALVTATRGLAHGVGFVLGPLGHLTAMLLQNKEVVAVLITLIGVKLAAALAPTVVALAADAYLLLVRALFALQGATVATTAKLVALQAAEAAATLGLTALIVGMVGWLIASNHEAEEFAGKIRDVDPTNLTRTNNAIREAQRELARLNGISKNASVGRRIVEFLPFTHDTVREAEQGGKQIGDALEDLIRRRDNLLANAQHTALHLLNLTPEDLLLHPEKIHDVMRVTTEVIEAATAAGIDLTVSEKEGAQVRKEAADEWTKLAGAVGLTAEAYAQLDEAHKEALKDLVEVGKKVSETFRSALDIISEFKALTPKEAAENIADAQDAVAAAHERVLDIQDRIRKARSSGNADHRELTRLSRERARAVEDEAEAQDKLRQAQEKNIPVGQQLIDQLKKQEEQAREFIANIQKAADMGVDPRFLARALEQGPEKAGPILKAIVDDSTGAVKEQVNHTEEALGELAKRAGSYAQLTKQAIADDSGELAAALGQAMSVVDAAIALGAKTSGDTIAHELGLVPERVEWLAQPERFGAAFGLAFGVGAANAIAHTLQIDASNRDYDAHYRNYYNEDEQGNFVGRASGGIDAHIARGTRIRYGEPSTGGEAYIPMGPRHRSRSTGLLGQVAHHFGYGLIPMAHGGILASPGGGGGRSTTNRWEFHGMQVLAADPGKFALWAQRQQRLANLTGGR